MKSERKASAEQHASKGTQSGILSSSCSIMRSLLRAAIAGSPVTEMRKGRIRLADGIERAVDLLDNRQDLARIDVGEAPGDEHRVLLLGDEAAH